jgi:hypothetical protein
MMKLLEPHARRKALYVLSQVPFSLRVNEIYENKVSHHSKPLQDFGAHKYATGPSGLQRTLPLKSQIDKEKCTDFTKTHFSSHPNRSYYSLILVTRIQFYSKNTGSQESGAYPIPAFSCSLQTWKKDTYYRLSSFSMVSLPDTRKVFPLATWACP